MIKLDFSMAVSVYLFITVIGLLVVWVIFDWKTKIEKPIIDRKDIWTCSICTYVYLDIKNDNLSICPRCRSYNKRNVHMDEAEGGDG